MNQPRLLIIGAASELGYRLTERALADGSEVVAADRHGVELRPLERRGATIRHADSVDASQIDALFDEFAGPDTAVVINLGGKPQINSQGNINVINAASASNCRRVVMVTSIGCGDSRASVDEFTKLFIDKALRAKTWAEGHLRTTGLDWTILRPGGHRIRNATGKGALYESPRVMGHINRTDLGDVAYSVLSNPATIGRTLAVIDRDHATAGADELPEPFAEGPALS